MHCGKWHFAEHSHQGKKGILAFWGNKCPSLGNLPEPQKSPIDGLWYYSPEEMPTKKQLAKNHEFPMYQYETNTGHTLSIPLAAGTPRIVDFLSMGFGDFSGEFAKKVQALEMDMMDDDADEILIDDPRIIELILCAIEQTYRVTPELLHELQWINSADISNIFDIIRGVHSK